ncbi:hypothetical protein ACFXPI_11415 [Streptomyces sp. NPDC059104]|uniref:hypothetical protein n=1 Tax=Streptomyces sp. NPDC059104 TaxID=3346729 RepID=UPI0036BAB604
MFPPLTQGGLIVQWDKYPDALCCISSFTGTPAPASVADVLEVCRQVVNPDLLVEEREGSLPALIGSLREEYGISADSEPPQDFIQYLWLILTAEYDGGHGYVFTLVEDGSKWVAPTPDTPCSSWTPYGDSALQESGWFATTDTGDAFYPELEGAAWSSVAQIGGSRGAHEADILVVPNGFDLQRGNPAVTVKSTQQVQAYRLAVDAHGDKGEWAGKVDAKKIQDRVHINTILVKHGLAENPGTELDGILWHEWGHVILDASESGRVFAHELEMILRHKGKETALAWYRNRPKGYYAQTAVEPGIDRLATTVSKFLTEQEISEFQAIAGRVAQTKRAAQERRSAVPRPAAAAPVETGDTISGTLRQLRDRIGPAARNAQIMGKVEAGRRVKLADITWEVISFDNGGEEKYELRRLS